MSLEKSLARHLDLEYDCQLVFPHTGFADAEKKVTGSFGNLNS